MEYQGVPPVVGKLTAQPPWVLNTPQYFFNKQWIFFLPSTIKCCRFCREMIMCGVGNVSEPNWECVWVTDTPTWLAQPQLCVCVNGTQLESCGHVNMIFIMLQDLQCSRNCGLYVFACNAPPKCGSKLIRPLPLFPFSALSALRRRWDASSSLHQWLW